MDHLYDVKLGKKGSVKDFILKRAEQHKDDMAELYRTWLNNIAWVRGRQNLDFDLSLNRYTKPETEPWRSRLISNLMLPLVRKNVAKIAHIQPMWDVIPATPDQEDIEIARTAKHILQDVWVQANMATKLLRVLFWQETCSSAFLKVGWDTEIGEEGLIDSGDVESQILQDFMELKGIPSIPEQIKTKEGGIFIQPVTPFNLILDNTVAVFEDSNFMIEKQLRSKDWIVEKFGNKWKKLPETKDADPYLYPFLYNTKGSQVQGGILTYEIFVKKCSKFPEGMYAFMAGEEEIIKPRKNPFEHGSLPYSHFLSIYDCGSLWGTCIAEQVRPNQARYNFAQSAITDQIHLMGKLQWMNPTQSGVKTFTNKPGGVIHYRHPYEPKQAQPKPIPGYITAELDRIRLDIQDTSSSHDVSEAKAEPGIRSGKAVLALQDADDSVLGPVLLWHDEALATIGVLTLQTIIQFTTKEKIIQIHGEFNELESLTFTGSSLVGENKEGYWKVRVKTYGRQMLSRSGREVLVRSLVEMGVLHPQNDRDKILHIMGTADLISLHDEEESDRSKQYKEILKMVNGETVKVVTGQSHDIHMKMIRKYISSGKWDRVEEKQQEFIINHLDDHLRMQAMEIAKQQAYLQQALVSLGVGNVGPPTE